MDITIGPGGTAGLGYEAGLQQIKEKGLSALEIEFTHGINMSNETAAKVGSLARELGIRLSIHAPYYINLAAKESEKRDASAQRILQACERGHHLGARHIVFHAGFYMGRDKEEVYQVIKGYVRSIMSKIEGWDVEIAPEVTGKPTQFGDLDELLRLRDETGCGITVDFSHLRARNQGIIDYHEVVKKLNRMDHVHAHFSGIEWTGKGERRHLLTAEEDIVELAEALKKRTFSLSIINESPDPINDAVLMKKVFSRVL